MEHTSLISVSFSVQLQDICLFMLENGADIDMVNSYHNTPFFLATESLQKEICQVRAALSQVMSVF